MGGRPAKREVSGRYCWETEAPLSRKVTALAFKRIAMMQGNYVVERRRPDVFWSADKA
jgi:hypothetical protein